MDAEMPPPAASSEAIHHISDEAPLAPLGQDNTSLSRVSRSAAREASAETQAALVKAVENGAPNGKAGLASTKGAERARSVGANVHCFVRVKPGPLSSSNFRIKETGEVVLKPPNALITSNNARDTFNFRLSGMLGQDSGQDNVFNSVAKPVVDSVLDGVSGAVMCYGQTGSGKTFTMTGGRSYADRGLIPRALSYALKKAEAARQEVGKDVYTLRMSYLEIYNERLIDLLKDVDEESVGAVNEVAGTVKQDPSIGRPAAMKRALDILEDGTGRIYTPGLRTPVLASEAEALALLFEGEANRALAEHALNAGSSRSHAVLTLYVEQKMGIDEATGPGGGMGRSRRKRHGRDVENSDAAAADESDERVTVVSKLHLVDLAGCERVSKTGSSGSTLAEAGYINSSLSFLEQCVVALLEPDRSHVPYRSSKLTHLLKEALGGACVTRLIANVWPNTEHLDESLQTLRFAARMMRVRTTPTRVLAEAAGAGGWADKARTVARYEAEVSTLRQELALHDALVSVCGLSLSRASLAYAPLSLHEVEQVKETMREFVGQDSARGHDVTGASLAPAEGGAGNLSALPTVRHLHAALHVLRDMLQQAQGRGSTEHASPPQSSLLGESVSMSRLIDTQDMPVTGRSIAGGRGEGGVVPVPMAAGTGQPSMSPRSRLQSEAARASALTDWREGQLGSRLTAEYAECKAASKDKKVAYNALAGSVNEAKKEIDRVMANMAKCKTDGVTGEPLDALASALSAAKGAYKSRHAQLQGAKAELDFCTQQAEAVGRKIASEFEKHWQAHGAVDVDPSTVNATVKSARLIDSREAYEQNLARKEARVAGASPQRGRKGVYSSSVLSARS